MKKPSILHLITAAKNASPFDVNMAFDAGYEKIVPYIHVALDEVAALTQDAIFSRSPSGIKEEALFFGGRDIHLALDMQKAARGAMFKPFEISTFSDPSGAFTTAAAMMAKVEAHLRLNQQNLGQQTIAIFGASGTVGSTAALIAARQGAKVKMMAHSDLVSMQRYVDNMRQRYDVQLEVVDGSNDASKKAVLQQATVALCAAPAGVRVLTLEHFAASTSLQVVADVNAVPPSGIEGVDVMANGVKVGDSKIVGFGALAIGRLKYVTQHELLKNMLTSDVPVHIDYHDAYSYACANAK
ncbi:MAG TPA: methylenetetrahydromethanopterin dehydrogenase [Methylophilaceae bacterium]|nr:methylenetetrahydromethanopterin dehydrogenase [Methylophilaceae bacterium]HAJ71129.1 methylenetetrahydromethanopterin dehydrogenase [Methylophilaceae bacterium]